MSVQPQTRCSVPTKLMVIVTTVVSTSVSLIAGILLYQESLSALRDTVAEVSKSNTDSAVRRLQQSFSDCEEFTVSGVEMFRGYEHFNATGYDHAIALFRHFSFASMKPKLGGMIYAFGVRMTKTWPSPNPSVTTPPWEDREGFLGAILEGQLGDDGGALWHSVEHTPDLVRTDPSTGAPYVMFTGETHNSLRLELDTVNGKPGKVLKFIKSNTQKTSGQMSDEQLIAGEWTGPSVSDGGRVDIPQVYMRYIKVINGADTTFKSLSFPHWDIMLRGYIQFQPWMRYLTEFQNPDTHLVAADFGNNLVFAHTLHRGIPIIPGCTASAGEHSSHEEERDCQLTVSALGVTLQAAAWEALQRPASTFFTVDLDGSEVTHRERYGKQQYAATGKYKVDRYHSFSLSGGEYFVRMERILSYNGRHIDLLWLRPVSSVNEKVRAALVQLVILCFVVFVVDLVIAVLEVVLIARPLSHVANSASALTEYNLEGAEASLNAATTCVSLTEVSTLLMGMRFAVCSLREYKAFLPQSLFAETSDEASVEDIAKSASSRGSSSLGRSSFASMMSECKQATTRLMVDKSKGVFLHAELLDVALGSDTSKIMDFLSFVEAAVSTKRGIFHGFALSSPNTLFASWGISRVCSGAKDKACETSLRIISGALPVAVGSAFGQCWAGNIGTETHRGVVVSGHTVNLSLSYLLAAREHAVAAKCSVAATEKGQVPPCRFVTLPIDIIKTGTNDRTVIVSVKAAVGVTEQEWMYQLDEADKSESPLNGIMDAIEKTGVFASELHTDTFGGEELVVYDKLVQRARNGYSVAVTHSPASLVPEK